MAASGEAKAAFLDAVELPPGELGPFLAALGDRDAALRSLQRIIDEGALVPRYLQREVRPWVRRARGAKRKLGH